MVSDEPGSTSTETPRLDEVGMALERVVDQHVPTHHTRGATSTACCAVSHVQ